MAGHRRPSSPSGSRAGWLRSRWLGGAMPTTMAVLGNRATARRGRAASRCEGTGQSNIPPLEIMRGGRAREREPGFLLGARARGGRSRLAAARAGGQLRSCRGRAGSVVLAHHQHRRRSYVHGARDRRRAARRRALRRIPRGARGLGDARGSTAPRAHEQSDGSPPAHRAVLHHASSLSYGGLPTRRPDRRRLHGAMA
jgi:hypothetical protein